jgi:hypothetical protein
MNKNGDEDSQITLDNYIEPHYNLNLSYHISDQEMEEALIDFYFEDQYGACEIIKYTVLVTRLRREFKQKLTYHSDYNKLFFDDLKTGKYLGRLFGLFPDSKWLEARFRLIKHEINEYENDKRVGKSLRIICILGKSIYNTLIFLFYLEIL